MAEESLVSKETAKIAQAGIDEGPPPDPTHFEIAIVCKKTVASGNGEGKDVKPDAAALLEKALVAAGLLVERVEGMDKETFLKIAAPVEVVARAAETLHLRKATVFGLEAIFAWDERAVFVRQPNGQLFNWTERYHCLDALIHTVKSEPKEGVSIRVPPGMKEVEVPPDVSLLPFLQQKELIKEIFPLHVEAIRRKLLRTWALNWFSFQYQPLDDIYAYFGAKVATYFAFLGIYTNWLWCIAVIGFYFYVRNWGSYHMAIPPAFGVLVVIWAVLFLQFWKRRNVELIERWEIRKEEDEMNRQEYDWSQAGKERLEEADLLTSVQNMKPSWQTREAEWKDRVIGLGSNVVALMAVVLFQLPVEIAYHFGLHSFHHKPIWQYALTAVYVGVVGQLTKAGGKLGTWLNRRLTFVSNEAAADALVFKVFGIYFIQSFFGLGYTAVIHRDFQALRNFLLRRLLVSQVIGNLTESLVPYLTYRYNRYKAFKAEQEAKKKLGEKAAKHETSDVERQYLMPPYVASIGDGQFDGIFDDFLELALQFGMVTMFACCFPLVGVFSLLNNLVEIRSDSFKLLSMLRRPVPHKVASIGSWLTIFQQLGVVAIVSNCVLVVYMYDEGKLQLDPGLLLVLVMEHFLLLTRYGLAWFIPEEPGWVKAKRGKRDKVREHFSAEVLRAFSSRKLTKVQ